MRKPSFLLLFGIIIIFRLSATNVSGPVTVNTTWTHAGSPYVVTGNVLIMEGITLTIEPGVEVRFDASKVLQVNGTLIARGTAADSIRFTSNTSQTPGAWGSIYFPDSATDVETDDAGYYLGGCIMEYCHVEFGGNMEGTNTPMLRLEESLPGIRNSSFENALNAAIDIYYLQYDTINYNLDNNRFRLCRQGITALSLLNRICVINSSFILNECAIDANGLLKIENNLFSQNSRALDLFGKEHVISNNEFSENAAMNHGSGDFIITLWGFTVDFYNNLCHHNGSDLIAVQPHDGHCIIRANVFTDNVSAAPPGSLIVLNFDNDHGYCPIFMENNLITNNSGYCPLEVKLSMNAQATFSSNVITNNLAPAEQVKFNSLAYGASDTTTTIFRDNVVTQNFSTSGFVTGFRGKINLAQNSLYNNGPSVYLLKNNNSSDFQPFLDISNNYWGVETAGELSTVIYDFFDDANLGITIFDSILLVPEATNPVLPPAGVLKTDLGNNRLQLSWLPNPEPDLKGYNVYWGKYTGYTFEHRTDAGINTSCIIEGASVDDTIAVTAYDNEYVSGMKSKNWLNENMINGHESTYSFELHYPLGLNETDKLSGFSVFPVPAVNHITVKLNSLADGNLLTIVNMQGNILKSFQLTDTTTMLDIGELARGIYCVLLSGGKTTCMKKIIKM